MEDCHRDIPKPIQVAVSPSNGGGGIAFQGEKKNTFQDLLQQLAQEHERLVAAKAAEKAAEIARLRFRLFEKQVAFRKEKEAARFIEKAKMTKTLPTQRALTQQQFTEPILPRTMTNIVCCKPKGSAQTEGDLLAGFEETWKTPRTPEKQPVARLILPGVPATGDPIARQIARQPTIESRSNDAIPAPDGSLLESKDSRDLEEDSAFQKQVFEMRDEWEDKHSPSFRASSRTPPAALRHHHSHNKVTRRSSLQLHDGFMRHFVSFPGSRVRVIWDLCGACLIFYDMIVIPLRVFDIPDSIILDLMDWFTLLFWTLNVFASFCVGYHKNGTTVMVPSKIALNYLRTWFCMDVLVVTPDWAFTLASLRDTGSRQGQQVRLLRILRLVRTVRLLRILKLRWLLASLNDRVDSEYSSILLSIAKMIVLLLSSNHFIACIWFLIAYLTETEGDTWITVHQFQDSSWFYQYLTAFHWSITQFTPASMHVQPQNTTERLFAVAVVVFALVGFSYVVGSITGSLAQIRSLHEDASKQFWNVRRYLRQNQVPAELSVRIQKYLEHAWQKQRHQVCLSGIKLFSLMSEQLSNELQLSMSVPHLAVHPLFEHLRDKCSATMTRLANTAISRKVLAAGDSLFYPGEAATHMYFVAQGRLQYIRVDPSSNDHLEWVDKDEDWISEPVLWTPCWIHLGMLNAETESDLLGIDADTFNRIISLNPAVFTLVSGYARRFVQWLNSKNYEDLSDIVQGEDSGGILRSFIPSMEDCSVSVPSIHSVSPSVHARTID